MLRAMFGIRDLESWRDFASGISLAWKFSLSQVIVVGLILVVGGFSAVAITGAMNDFRIYRDSTAAASAVNTVQAKILETQLGVKDFIIEGNEEAIEVVQNNVIQSMMRANEASSLLTTALDQQKIATIMEDLAIYTEDFQLIADLQRDLNRMIEEGLTIIGEETGFVLAHIMRTSY